MINKHISFSDLFKERDETPVFKNAIEEIRAVTKGKKAMAVYLLAGGHEESKDVKNLRKFCTKEGVITVNVPQTSEGEFDEMHTYLFALKYEEMWRIKPYLVMMKIIEKYGWSSSIEALEGYLLGYSEEQISKWLSDIKDKSLSWNGLNIYLCMSADQWESTKCLGEKSFDKNLFPDGLDVCYMRKNVQVNDENIRNIDRSIKICRCCVNRQFFSDVFGPYQSWESDTFVVASINSDNIRNFNYNLLSKIQTYCEGRWQ